MLTSLHFALDQEYVSSKAQQVHISFSGFSLLTEKYEDGQTPN
jgi:hypothetical protein